MTAADIVALEEGALNGWPALRTEAHGGWLWRFAGGYTKRANSVHPLYEPAPVDAERRLDEAAEAYARAGLAPTIKVPGHPAWKPLDDTLTSRGYRHLDESRVLSLEALPSREPEGFRWRPRFEPSWADGFFEAATVAEVHRPIARSLSVFVDRPVVGWVEDQGAPVAWGYAALVEGQAWLYDLVVAPSARRRGHGRALVNGLLVHARAQGARRACLQVLAANAPAAALYQSLGFAEAYRYWYRRKL